MRRLVWTKRQGREGRERDEKGISLSGLRELRRLRRMREFHGSRDRIEGLCIENWKSVRRHAPGAEGG